MFSYRKTIQFTQFIVAHGQIKSESQQQHQKIAHTHDPSING